METTNQHKRTPPEFAGVRVKHWSSRYNKLKSHLQEARRSSDPVAKATTHP